MLMRSGGRLSVAAVVGPMLSRSLFVAHSAPVVGLKARPTELRSPRANNFPFMPFRSYCITAARSVSVSGSMLLDEPIDTYIESSGPKAMLRVECPPQHGRFDTSWTGVAT